MASQAVSQEMATKCSHQNLTVNCCWGPKRWVNIDIRSGQLHSGDGLLEDVQVVEVEVIEKVHSFRSVRTRDVASSSTSTVRTDVPWIQRSAYISAFDT